MNIAKGFCQCGCGAKTRLAVANNAARGWVKGEPVRFVFGHGMKGKANAWKGGRIVNQDGYIMITAPGHPRADRRGYVLEHILVLEKTLGRPVLLTEASHHIDGNRLNNAPGNLMLFRSAGMHTAFHNRLRRI